MSSPYEKRLGAVYNESQSPEAIFLYPDAVQYLLKTYISGKNIAEARRDLNNIYQEHISPRRSTKFLITKSLAYGKVYCDRNINVFSAKIQKNLFCVLFEESLQKTWH